MLSQQSLQTLLNIPPALNAPLLSIFVQEKTARLDYVCEFIFKHVLGTNYRLLTDLNEFKHAQEPKINYSSNTLSQCLQILPNGLLYEKGISQNKPEILIKNDCLYFFENKTSESTPSKTFHFDLFSAVFYLISRYEEWQHYTPDMHLRFEAGQSSLFKAGFHLKPLVEIWIEEFKQAIQKSSQEFVFPQRKFQIISTIDIDNLYAFKSKGLLRTFGAGVKDLLKGDFENFTNRLQVLSGKKQDPFDIYESVSDFCFEKKIPLIYFFLFKSGEMYNRTVNPASGAFQPVFRILKKNHALFGLHPSYDAAFKNNILEKEIKDFSLQSGEVIHLSRQHYLRFDIRSTPNLLLGNGIQYDFTMGYASQPGFRAGTSRPFYYFDFNSEKRSDLLFVPFCVMDGAFTIYKNTGPEEAYKHMLSLAKEVRQVNGTFISVFHERSFSDHLYPGFGTLYKKLHEELKDL